MQKYTGTPGRPAAQPQGQCFSDEDIAELVKLGEVLKIIRSRLVANGKMPDTKNKD